MREGPYVRPNLAATRDGVPDPAIEVEAWLDRLETILASEGPDWSSHGAYDLLAGWAKLKRARADLIHILGTASELADAQRVLSERGDEVAQLALTVPNPQAWREETVSLEASYERPIDPVERSTLAERLITDLDDAELVLYAVDQLGMKEPALEQEISECRLWLMEHAGLFLAASVHIQAVGMALRPDLSDYDYRLAVTALKYERLLDAAEEIEAELALEGLRPIPQDVVDVYLKGAVLAFPQSILQRARLAAASEAKAPSLLKWVSPEGDWVAFLPLLPAKDPGSAMGAVVQEPETGYLSSPRAQGEMLILRFYAADGEPATALAGRPVVLAGVTGRIDPESKAVFPMRAIEESEENLRLEVGEPKVPWHPQPV